MVGRQLEGNVVCTSVKRKSWKMRKRTVKCKMIEKLREVEKSKKSQEKLEKNERN
jgi:hypothetical protein